MITFASIAQHNTTLKLQMQKLVAGTGTATLFYCMTACSPLAYRAVD
jgi:hypothetical protein